MGSIREERDLTPSERRLIECLIRHGRAVSGDLLEQLAVARVVSRCGCGCPTIDLAVGDRLARTTGGWDVVGDAAGLSPEGVAITAILHVRDGLLAELEVYASSGYNGPFTLPDPEQLNFD
jgi:hypothetical protein